MTKELQQGHLDYIETGFLDIKNYYFSWEKNTKSTEQIHIEEDTKQLKLFSDENYQALLDTLKKAILNETILKFTDYSRIFLL